MLAKYSHGHRMVGALLLALAMMLGFPAAPIAPQAEWDDNIVVVITSPQPGERVQGRVEIAGYAADLRSPRGSGLNERDVQVSLDDYSDLRNFVDYAQSGLSSPAAVRAYGPERERTGFRLDWDACSRPPGRHRLNVLVSSLTTPGGRNLASVDVETIPCPTGPATEAAPTDGLGQVWEECETYATTICGVWTREGASAVWTARWGGVTAQMLFTVDGRRVTIARIDTVGPLRATYQGTVSDDGTGVSGTVDWCCDRLGDRSGTWEARIRR